MILDSSAIIAVFLKEPQVDRVIDALANAKRLGVGTPTLVEAGIVLSSQLGDLVLGQLGRLLDEFGCTTIPFIGVHWREAVVAYQRFGKGRHRAALNFGDCLSYATAKLAGEPLLCLGDDFAHTDLPLVPLGK